MTLLELFQAVKEETLTKTDLEKYRDALSNLYAEMQIEMATIEKSEAMYFYNRTNPETTDISIKRQWKATPDGQRQILLNRYLKATEKVLSSLKSRIYAQY